MKKAFLLLCALLLVLGSASAAGRLPAGPGGAGRGCCLSGSPGLLCAARTGREPARHGHRLSRDRRVRAETPRSSSSRTRAPGRCSRCRSGIISSGRRRRKCLSAWPDEALKAQIVAAHSYALYCRDHASAANGSWLSADPARRQGYLTDAVLHSYWGTRYEANYIRLSALVDSRPRARSSAMTVRRQGRAILPSPTAAPRPARTSGAAALPYLVAGGQQHRPLQADQLRGHPDPLLRAGTGRTGSPGAHPGCCRAGTVVQLPHPHGLRLCRAAVCLRCGTVRGIPPQSAGPAKHRFYHPL